MGVTGMTERGEPAQEERAERTVQHGEDSDAGVSRGRDSPAARPVVGRQGQSDCVLERLCGVSEAGRVPDGEGSAPGGHEAERR